MRDYLEKAKELIMYFTFRERKKRALQSYKSNIEALRNMTEDELNLEYIDVKCTYEHKKNWLMAILIAILLAILMSSWKFFGNLIASAAQHLLLGQQAGEIYEVGVVLCSIFVLFISIIIVWALISYFREIRRLYSKLLLIEEVKNSS